MRKATAAFAAITALILILCSCDFILPQIEETTKAEITAVPDVTVQPVTDAATVTDPADENKTATGDFTITPGKDAGEVSVSGAVYKITKAGEYTLKGNLPDGQVVVDAGDDDEVVLILDGASVSSTTGAPILFVNASSATVKSEADTYNTVTDKRADDPVKDSDSEENYDAAIFAKCDLKINGKGTLIVESSYDNGIKSKDDLKIKNVTLKVTSTGAALKGNDEVRIESGELMLISTSSDGIKTSNSGVSSKGNKKGNVVIEDGHVDVYAAKDGISASRNVEISQKDGCSVNIFTSKYANLTDVSASGTDLYLIVPKGTYSEKYDYYAYFYNDEGDGVWKKCEYECMIYSGRSANYYGLLVKVPSSYKSIMIHVVNAGEKPDGENYVASSGGETVNAAMNGYLITGISSKLISTDWVQLSTNGGGNSNKTTYSSKGIKAESEIIISGGAVTVYCMDDGLHANYGGKLQDNTAGLGNITVSNCSVLVNSSDDGMHADGKLIINSGYVKIEKAHEGLEGNVVEINGGEVYVYGDDDGINACKGNSQTLINITGGHIEVTTPSGDTDAIDANGSITMSGGFLLVIGGASSGSVAGSIDVDGKITVTGGTIVALGGICEVPESGSVNTYASKGTSFTAGEYKLTDGSGNEILSFKLDSSYSSIWIASESIEMNQSYKITKDGSKVLEWTQTSNIQGYSGGGFGPGGGPGGFGPGGRR